MKFLCSLIVCSLILMINIREDETFTFFLDLIREMMNIRTLRQNDDGFQNIPLCP